MSRFSRTTPKQLNHERQVTMPSKKTNQKRANDDCNLCLSRAELSHLRDLFSVTVLDQPVTVSQNLTSVNGFNAEHELWQKIALLCKQQSLPVDDSAPDYSVWYTELPSLGICKK